MENEEKDKIQEEPIPEEHEAEQRANEVHGNHEKDRKRRKIAEQAEEIEKLKQEKGELKDQYLRLQAEWDNYRRRTAKERLELVDSASKKVLTGFLPILDDCQRALNVLRESAADGTVDAQAAVEGTELIYNKLTAYLNSCGVERIDAVGAAFDTDFHEAVAQFPVEDPAKKNTVIDVTQEGYTLNGAVIRYAKVVVGI
jgi:molecular chaperone GrpE